MKSNISYEEFSLKWGTLQEEERRCWWEILRVKVIQPTVPKTPRVQTDWSQATQKRCTKCNEVKEVTLFSRLTNIGKGCSYSPWCKKCMAQYQKNKRGTKTDKPYSPRLNSWQEVLATGMKTCYICKQTLPVVSSFHHYTKSKDGYDSRCKPCFQKAQEAKRDPQRLRRQHNSTQAIAATGMKYCGKCCQTKQVVSEFTRSTRGTGGYNAHCKACTATRGRTRYARRANHEVRSYVLYGRRTVPAYADITTHHCKLCDTTKEKELFKTFTINGVLKPQSICKECSNKRSNALQKLHRARKKNADNSTTL